MSESPIGIASGVGLIGGGGAYGRQIFSEKNANLTTFFNGGMGAATAAGTAGQSKTAQGEFVTYDAAAGGSCGVVWSANDIQTVTRPRFHARVLMPPAALTNLRLWVGLFSADPATADNPAGHLAGFRYSAGVDTFFMACTKDNVTLNAQATTVSPVVATGFDFSIACESATITFSINGVAVMQSSANLPGSTTALDSYCRGRDKGAAAPVVQIGVCLGDIQWP